MGKPGVRTQVSWLQSWCFPHNIILAFKAKKAERFCVPCAWHEVLHSHCLEKFRSSRRSRDTAFWAWLCTLGSDLPPRPQFPLLKSKRDGPTELCRPCPCKDNAAWLCGVRQPLQWSGHTPQKGDSFPWIVLVTLSSVQNTRACFSLMYIPQPELSFSK